jgi:hypothetical protein
MSNNQGDMNEHPADVGTCFYCNRAVLASDCRDHRGIGSRNAMTANKAKRLAMGLMITSSAGMLFALYTLIRIFLG